MQYLGLDVHVKSINYCLLDQTGNLVKQGKIPTTTIDIQKLAQQFMSSGEIMVGQEIGKMAYLVHDALQAIGSKILSFNAHHLRVIASSRKKTDKRDAYWLAKILQSGMTPHPVYMPSGKIRRLRNLLAQRTAVVQNRKSWTIRARSYLQAAGYSVAQSTHTMRKMIAGFLNDSAGMEAELHEALAMCARMQQSLNEEEKRLDQILWEEAKDITEVKHLMTIPAIGQKVAITIYAWVGDVTRFNTARELSSYAGLVPSVWQSGETQRQGGITKTGSPQLRTILIQAGHVLISRCRSVEAVPLRSIALRIITNRGRRKIAVVAAARHILRIAYYVMRDGTEYDPQRLRLKNKEDQQVA